MANGRTRFQVLRISVPPEPEESFPRSYELHSGSWAATGLIEWLRRKHWQDAEPAGCSVVKACVQSETPVRKRMMKIHLQYHEFRLSRLERARRLPKGQGV